MLTQPPLSQSLTTPLTNQLKQPHQLFIIINFRGSEQLFMFADAKGECLMKALLASSAFNHGTVLK